jgi:hypothetical protein
MPNVTLTPQQADALKKNLSDRRWRLDNLYFITDKNGNKIKFKLKPAQEYILKNLHYFDLILKSRQHGITTLMCILFLDECLFTKNLSAAIVAQTEEDARSIFASKIKFAYQNLDPLIKEYITSDVNRKDRLEFSNGSSIVCDCSLRGGTFQRLHISEFGPMCSNAPERAMEVISGALNTVHPGNIITIESTGEGEDGEFYRLCQIAMKDARAKKKLSKMEFKFFFLAWMNDDSNVLPAGSMVITKEYEDYFSAIQPEIKQLSDAGMMMPIPGGVLSDQQKAWYVAKAMQQGENMHSQHPSVPDESFRSTAEGRYYRKQMNFLHENKRICRVPHEIKVTVNTAWDLGADNYTAIWFHQKIGPENRLIGYYENYGEDLSHYVRYLQGLRYVWGRHYLPHDAAARRLSMDNASVEQQLQSLGLRGTEVVSRTNDLLVSIEDTRQFLMTCWFDEKNCDVGLKHLQAYRKQRDKQGRWKDSPLHDEHSDGSDSFRCLAVGLLSGLGSGKGSEFLKKRKKPDMRAFR